MPFVNRQKALVHAETEEKTILHELSIPSPYSKSYNSPFWYLNQIGNFGFKFFKQSMSWCVSDA